MMLRGGLLVAILMLGACSGGGGSSGGGTTVTGGTVTTGGTTGGGVSTGLDGFSFDTGIGGSGGIIGDIDGFGSVIMNGLELNTDDAEFYIEGDSGFSQSDLREGYYIVVAGDITDLDAEEVVYRSNLKGPVSADPDDTIDPSTGVYELTVLDQKVLTSATTRFDGVIVENIVQGDLLEVSGPIDSGGRVLATYVALKATLGEYKAIGNLSSLDTTAMTFDLMGLPVDYSSATLSEFEGAALADGQLVEVKLDTTSFPAAGAVTVTEVELLPVAEIEEGAEIEIEGLIDSFVDATEFTVGGLPVTTDGNTSFEDGSAAQLALNVKVEVEGVANANGVIVAQEIELKSDNAIRVEGAVTGVNVAASTVTAMEVTFEVRASTELEDDRDGEEPFGLNQLMIGDFVEIRGYLESTTVVAVELEREETPDPGDFRTLLRGPLTAAVDESAGTVEIQGVTIVELDGITDYEDQDEQSISRAAFYNLLEIGDEVKAEWDNFGSFSDPADSLSLEEEDD